MCKLLHSKYLSLDSGLILKGLTFILGHSFVPSLLRERVQPTLDTSTETFMLVQCAKSFFNFNEIWRVGRRRQVMLDGIQYDLIQGQGHEPFKVRKFSQAISSISNGSWQLTTDS